jgi:hypothetical protein
MASINVVDTNLMKPLHFNISENKALKKQMVHSWDVFWESTPQPVPKHTPTFTKAHTESVLLVFVRACFGVCWDVLSRVCFGPPRVCFGVAWGVLC